MAIYNREDPRTALPQLEKLVRELEPHKINIRLVSTAGTIKVASVFKSGQTVTLRLTASNASAVAGGDNIAEGRLENYRPVQVVNGIGLSWARSIVSTINNNGNLFVRNASSNSLPANSEVSVTTTYITGDK